MRDLVKPTKYGQLLLLNKLDRLFLDSDPIMHVPGRVVSFFLAPIGIVWQTTFL